MIAEGSSSEADAEKPRPIAATVVAYLALTLCFAIANFPNAILLKAAQVGLGAGFASTPSATLLAPGLSPADFGHYWLGSARDTVFFVGLATLLWLMRTTLRPLGPILQRRQLWIDALIGLAIASVFLFQIWPVSMGQVYALNSTDPFMQEAGTYNRRLLLPALAHLLHFGGVAYPLFYWAVVLVTLLLFDAVLERRGLALSRLERASLYTTGIFGTALALPGSVEILVLTFAIVAMLAHDRLGRTTLAQPILFGLALLTHESAALLTFGALALCRFDSRFLRHYLLLTAIYALLWLASFGFGAGAAVTAQRSGGLAGIGWAIRHIPLIVLGVAATYKLTLLALAAAVTILARTGARRDAALILLAIAGGTALTLFATDYSRLIAFGSFALVVALPAVLTRLSAGQRRAAALANLALPTVMVSAHHIVAYNGLYGLAATTLFGLRR